jgi:hypothetical protein
MLLQAVIDNSEEAVASTFKVEDNRLQDYSVAGIREEKK